MPSWTLEQKEAIDKENTRIIVSAGAGSGKTAVLSERALRKLIDGVSIESLLLLTFTNKAAEEMKVRIRNKIKDNILKFPFLKEQLSKIDSAYITTFDAYSLSLVKKYSYLLGVSNDIKIVDNSIVNLKKKEILDNIFDRLYEEKNELFLKLISDYTLKEDDKIKEYILKTSSKLDLKYDKLDFLDKYLDNYYNNEIINTFISKYLDILKNKITEIITTLKEISTDNEKFNNEINILIDNFENVCNYDDILLNCNVDLPRLPKNQEDEVKFLKEKAKKQIDNLKKLLIYESQEDIINKYMDTSSYIKIIIDIIKMLDKEITSYKYETNSFEFIDISKLAIKLVKENEEVRDEIKYSFNEIMIDEYQDTSDLQEIFISQIENNNTYTVGDIKQSIYRFRNANPYIFKNKYDNYSNNNGGYKIDLNKNFRSREEVLKNINDMFDIIMDLDMGGADYKKSHRMESKNGKFIENKINDQNYNLDILNYNLDKEYKYSKSEVEIFIIAKDIKEKIDNKFQVMDKDTNSLRDITYSDFAILIDTSKRFNLYKKVFEYLNIPLSVDKGSSITESNDLIIINNILRLIKKIRYKEFDTEFKRYFISIARSYLFCLDDNEIFNIYKNNSYSETTIYKLLEEIANNYDNSNLKDILYLIIDKFNIYERQLIVGDIEKQMARVSYIIDMFDNYISMNYSIDDAIDSFNTLIDNEEKIECKLGSSDDNSVKIMTVHASKGLEFYICYFPDLNNRFNLGDIQSKMSFDNEYGFIIPSLDNDKDNINKLLYKNKFIIEEVSEKIRLFYVALTRAREKMIFVTNFDLDNIKEINKYDFRCISDMLSYVIDVLNPYIINIDVDNLDVSREYAKIKKSNYKEEIKNIKDTTKYIELNIDNEVIEQESFSKKMLSLINKDDLKIIESGKRFHYIFETIDFIKPNFDNLNEFEKNKVKAFLKLDILKDIFNYKIYKEYEFMYLKDRKEKHGIIDLMLENDDKIMIIDYKLKNIVDDNYLKQLSGYKEYISLKKDKEVEIYLYSIIDEKLEKLM